MRRLAVAFSLLVLLASGCSLGPREDWAEAVRDADEEATKAGTARARMAVDVKVIETVIRQEPVPLIARLEGVVDFDERTSKLIGARRSKAISMFVDDLIVYLPRSSASIGAGTGRKPWARYDFKREPSEDLDDTDRLRSVGAGMISPVLAVELLEGVLTGSIRRVGTESVTGVATTHYRARLSPEAASQEMEDDDRSEGLLRLFETLGVQQDLFPVDVWLDDHGLARRVTFVMRQQKDRVNAFELRLAWELYDYGVKVESASVPPRAQTLQSPRFRAFIEEFIRETG